VAVGTGYYFDILALGIADHRVDFFVEERFPPTPQMKQEHVVTDFIN
jgi:hypothetical protein